MSKLTSIADIPRRYEELEMSKLGFSENQMRVSHIDKDIVELARSIETVGLLEPIVVAPSGEEGNFDIITGQRRYNAFLYLERDRIPAIVLEKSPSKESNDQKEIREKTISLTENMMRLEPAYSDYCDVFETLHRRYGSVKNVSEATGLPIKEIEKYINYAGLTEHMQRAYDDSKIDMKRAKLIDKASQGSKPLAMEMLSEIENMTRGKADRFIKAVKQETDKKGAEGVMLSVSEIVEREGVPDDKPLNLHVSNTIFNALTSFANDSGYKGQVSEGRKDVSIQLINEGLTNKGYLDDDVD